MGSQAKVAKLRQCGVCKEDTWMTAEQLKEHASMCERMQLIGFELPSIAKPIEPLIIYDGYGE